jgi:hypothetical protein
MPSQHDIDNLMGMMALRTETPEEKLRIAQRALELNPYAGGGWANWTGAIEQAAEEVRKGWEQAEPKPNAWEVMPPLAAPPEPQAQKVDLQPILDKMDIMISELEKPNHHLIIFRIQLFDFVLEFYR